MRLKTLTGAALLTIAFALTACGTSTNDAQPSSQSPQAMTQGSSSVRAGTFAGLNDKHVAGTVKVAGGQVVLSDFSSDAGPDLHIYLTNGTDKNAVAAGKLQDCLSGSALVCMTWAESAGETWWFGDRQDNLFLD